MKRRTIIQIGAIVVVVFVALNVAAFLHAYHMTHFVAGGARTLSPDRLSAWQRIRVLTSGVVVPKPQNDRTPQEHGLVYRTVTFPTRDRLRLEAWDIPAVGASDVVVMFPGYAVAKSVLYGEALALNELGHHCLLVDFRGTGGSDGADCTLGWLEARDVAAAATWASREWPDARVVLYGQSMGATAVLRAMATEAVQPSAVVLECPFNRLVTTVGHRYRAMGLPAFPLAQLLVFWGGLQHGFNAFTLNPAEYARAVTSPTLVLEGDCDSWVKVSEATAVAAAMRGAAEVHVFKGGGHGAYVWSAPDEYRRVVGQWLEKIRVANGQLVR
jgi:pimeloyl-ACP methyl ester carboxylesterase